MEEATKESPLKDYEIPNGIFQKEDEHPLNLDNWDIKHWETVLKNRFLSVNRNFGYAMFYYYKGISDDLCFASPGTVFNPIYLFCIGNTSNSTAQ